MDVLKKLIDLIKSIHGARTALAVIGTAIWTWLLTLPALGWFGIAVGIVLLLLVLAYVFRRDLLFTSFHTASQKAYEQLDGTLWKDAADKMHDEPSPANSLTYIGQALIHDGALRLYGNQPPSRVFRKIDLDIAQHAAVQDECQKLQPSGPKALPWVDLKVKRSELRARIKEMKRNDVTNVWKKKPALYIALLQEAAKGDGTLEEINTLDGTSFNVRSKFASRSIYGGLDAEMVAAHRDAIEKLLQKDWLMLVSHSANSKFYQLTGSGWQRAKGSN